MISAATEGKNHLFGFHDLIAFNKTGEKLLSLEVDIINRPPLPGEKISVGYSLWESREFIKLGETNAFNYPQGARQQWLNNNQFIVNNQIGDKWGADIYDVESGLKIDQIESTSHCVTKDSRYTFGINYSRLHRLGGYGYIGIADPTENEEKPSKDGIFKTNLISKKTDLLVSIQQVANCDIATSANNGFHHYVTHLVLNPSNTRIAFLHRFFLSDGGIRTRLMTIGTDGKDLRCIACGFLSHFDWKDDSTIFIWGRAGAAVDALRSNPILSNPVIAPLVQASKGIIRKLMKRTSQMNMSFLLVKDSDIKSISPVAQGIITSDGHPMFCPTDRNIIINDNYPDKVTKCRDLMLYNFETNQRTDIGKFRMLDDQPDTTLFSEYTKGVDKKILSLMSPDLFSFTRSGLHCDLHPRWNADGTMGAFDSIHEGSRQIYVFKR